MIVDIRERIARAIQARIDPRCSGDMDGFMEGLAVAADIARETSPWAAVDDRPPDEGHLVLTRSAATGHPFLVTWDAANRCFRDEEGSLVPALCWMAIPR
jgi:hypothetical protein